jgi:hypothetical protein
MIIDRWPIDFGLKKKKRKETDEKTEQKHIDRAALLARDHKNLLSLKHTAFFPLE